MSRVYEAQHAFITEWLENGEPSGFCKRCNLSYLHHKQFPDGWPDPERPQKRLL